MDCRVAHSQIHDYLDGELGLTAKAGLDDHLRNCANCRERLDELEQAEVLFRYAPAAPAPELSTERIMLALPKPRKLDAIKGWIKRYPATSVAAVFLLVMMSSFATLWESQPELVVKVSDLDELVIQGNLVVVPAGTKVKGDLIVENGQLQIDGEVDGNVTVVGGSFNVASTAVIAGDVQDIHQSIDYFWYKIKQFFTGFSQ